MIYTRDSGLQTISPKPIQIGDYLVYINKKSV